MTDALGPRLGQQLLNDNLRPFVFTFAELMMPNMPLRVDKVQGWPILVLEGVPDRKVIIDGDRVFDHSVFYGPANVVDALFKFELGCLHADDNQSLALVVRGRCGFFGYGSLRALFRPQANGKT